MSDDPDTYPRARPLTQEELRRAYAHLTQHPDRLVASAARWRLRILPKEDERELPVEENAQ